VGRQHENKVWVAHETFLHARKNDLANPRIVEEDVRHMDQCLDLRRLARQGI
jgi:hypothetical protein